MLVSMRASTKFSGTLIFEVRFTLNLQPPHPSFEPLFKKWGHMRRRQFLPRGKDLCKKSGNNGHLIQGTSNFRGAGPASGIALPTNIPTKWSFSNDESHREDP